MNRNKLTKKVLAGLMGTAVLLTAPVYAENEDSRDMEVIHTVPDTYTLSIPDKITLDRYRTVSEKLGIKEANIQPGKKLYIKMTSAKALLKRQGDKSGSEKMVTTGLTVSSVDIAKASSTTPVIIAEYQGTITEETKNKQIFCQAPKDADGSGIIEAGTYTGSITFIAEIK